METPTPTPSVPTPTPAPQVTPPPTQQMPRSGPVAPQSSKALSWFAVILVIAVLGFSYYAIGSDQGWWPFPEPAPYDELTDGPADTSSPSPEDSPVAAEDSTAGWETYSDEQQGFEVRYPPGVQAVKSEFGGVLFSLPVPGDSTEENPWMFLSIYTIPSSDRNDPDVYGSGGPVIAESGSTLFLWTGPQECPEQSYCEENAHLIDDVLETFQLVP